MRPHAAHPIAGSAVIEGCAVGRRNALHGRVGVEVVAAGDGGGVDEEEGTERGAGREKTAGDEGEGKGGRFELGDAAELGKVFGKPYVEGELEEGGGRPAASRAGLDRG